MECIYLYISKYSYYGDYTEPESTASSFANEYQVSVFSSSFGNKYQFNSSGVIGETLGFIAGNSYNFTLSDSSLSNPPFQVSSNKDGVRGGGVDYTPGVSSQNGSISISATETTPDLYYFCGHHSGMGGRIRILKDSNGQENNTFINDGTEKVFGTLGSYEDYTVSASGDNWVIQSSETGVDTIKNFERIEFDDGTLALDVGEGETAGQAYRLYQAAFARTPDLPGVAYHMNDMENNGLSITQIASNFIASPEFKTKYGDNPTEEQYINLLYQNVLNRTPAEFEVEYYKDRFQEGSTDWNTTLVFFAESPENILAVAPKIENGVFLSDIA